jgi:putative transposase
MICYAVWLYYRSPLSLRMVEELLAARGIDLTSETVRRWSVTFGLSIARRIRSNALARCSTCWCKAGATATRLGLGRAKAIV